VSTVTGRRHLRCVAAQRPQTLVAGTHVKRAGGCQQSDGRRACTPHRSERTGGVGWTDAREGGEVPLSANTKRLRILAGPEDDQGETFTQDAAEWSIRTADRQTWAFRVTICCS